MLFRNSDTLDCLLFTLEFNILRKGMSKPASSSSHCIWTWCWALAAVRVKVLMKRRQDTWKEEPFQLFSIPAGVVRSDVLTMISLIVVTGVSAGPKIISKFNQTKM